MGSRRTGTTGKSTRLKRLERDCARLATQAQKRLQESAQIRQGCALRSVSAVSKSAKETLWMSRERAKSAMYEHLRSPSGDTTEAQGSPICKRPQSAQVGSRPPFQPVQARPRSAHSSSLHREDSGDQAMKLKLEALKEDCRTAWEEVGNRSATEQALRETVDLLRGRLHAQTQREIDNQRRLQMHTKLEPLFDRLAETFVFKSPEEVVDRLEFLENDKLGNMDLLIRAQEDNRELRNQLEAAQKKLETTTNQLQIEHNEGVAKLQQQTETLAGEVDTNNAVITKLHDRQKELVELQSAVMDLYSWCMKSPKFAKLGDDIDVKHPLTMVTTIQRKRPWSACDVAKKETTPKDNDHATRNFYHDRPTSASPVMQETSRPHKRSPSPPGGAQPRANFLSTIQERQQEGSRISPMKLHRPTSASPRKRVHRPDHVRPSSAGAKPNFPEPLKRHFGLETSIACPITTSETSSDVGETSVSQERPPVSPEPGHHGRSAILSQQRMSYTSYPKTPDLNVKGRALALTGVGKSKSLPGPHWEVLESSADILKLEGQTTGMSPGRQWGGRGKSLRKNGPLRSLLTASSPDQIESLFLTRNDGGKRNC
ncbi:hypothetical protein BSKO_00425 [Bryopsis sp. KO-2023]|nr:hypothetical protein BSKO_00425 [Bryopsis sp. KO-2023]